MNDGTGDFTARQIEKILRDGGCSKRLAREIIARGYQSATQDAGPDIEAVTKLVRNLRTAIEHLKGLTRNDRLRY